MAGQVSFRAPDAAQREAVRCRAGAVTNSGGWYGPGSAERHEECRTAPGTRERIHRVLFTSTGASCLATSSTCLRSRPLWILRKTCISLIPSRIAVLLGGAGRN